MYTCICIHAYTYMFVSSAERRAQRTIASSLLEHDRCPRSPRRATPASWIILFSLSSSSLSMYHYEY